MAGTISISSRDPLKSPQQAVYGERIVIDFVGDASGGSVPTLAISNMAGIIDKILTNPGSPAPTDNWDIALYHPNDATLDVLGGALVDRDTTTSEVKAPVLTGSSLNVAVNGTYTLAVTGNSVNSATGQIVIEMLFL